MSINSNLFSPHILNSFPHLEILNFREPMPYREIWDLQKKMFKELTDLKREGLPIEKEYLLLLQHTPVLTLGKHGKEENLLLNQDQLDSKGIECIRIERGGDITYHGPGQLTIYSIIDLESHHIGVKKYVELLEECVIRVLADYGVKGERVDGASGVWIGAGTKEERKICAVGVKCSRFITMHGLGFNINTDLSGFSLINPCGFIDKGVTSLALELNKHIPLTEISACFASHFRDIFYSSDIK